MEGQCGHENPLQLMSLAFGGDASDMSHSDQDNLNQQYIMAAGGNQMPPVPLSLPHWIHCEQQASHSYIGYLAENGVADIHREMLYNNPGVTSGFKWSADSSVGMDVQKVESNAVFQEAKYLRPHNEGRPTNNFTSAEYQMCVQKQESNGPQSRAAVAAPGFSHKPRNHISRRKTTSTDRSRRWKIAERLDALQELLPHRKEGDKASQLHDIIDHIKYLQFQIKDLSQSRLGGELISDPFVFLEGYGHYLLHEQMLNEPLEETMGRLLEVNPSTATQLLESRGLVIMPTVLAEGLHQAV